MVSIILLALMTLLATASLRTGIQEERISATARDRDLAFQSAEAGLRIGEAAAEQWAQSEEAKSFSLPEPVEVDNLCDFAEQIAEGLYGPPDPDCAPLWDKEPGTTGAFWHKASDSFATSGLSLTPYYIVEYISGSALCYPADKTNPVKKCKRFRITASSDATAGRAAVMLQSIYATGDNPP